MIRFEVEWKASSKTFSERTSDFFAKNTWAILKNNDYINGIFSFGNKGKDIIIDDIREINRNSYWAAKLIEALKQETDIKTIRICSEKELEDLQDKGEIQLDESFHRSECTGIRYVVPLNK